ncbi:MAG: hypothetical protein QNK37_11425 [Acidobacteriota bacterium]|nr:hypothetical protein [Acidobacteriota bacterium]
MRFLASSILLIALAAPSPLMARGKNKVVDQTYNWKIYESEHFKIYHYEGTEHLLEDVANKVEAAYTRISGKLQHELNFKVPFIFYKTHEEFSHTNVFPGFLPRSVGAFAEPFQSRILMPVDLAPEPLYALIVHELTHIFQYDMLYNNRISTIIRAQTPTWFDEGMASYVADDENNLDRMVLRDVAVNASGALSLRNFGNQSYIAYRVGHAAFDYIEEQYGIEGVRDFLWQFRKNIAGNVGGAISRAFEISPEEFDRDFRKYLRKRYVWLLPEKEEPDDHAREIRTRRTITTLSPELSPSGDLFAAIVPVKNELDLVLISTKDGRLFKNLTKGITNKYTEINVGAYSGINDLGWNNDGNEIAFAARQEGTMVLFISNVLTGKEKEMIKFDEIRDAQSPVFSKDNNTIYFGGNRRGFFDIFAYDRTTKEIKNITNDKHMDRNPRVSPDGKEILYSSSRDGFFKIFSIDLATSEQTQLTSGLGNDIQATYSDDMSSIYFSSDRFDDIYNIYELDLDTGVKKQYTNILTGAFAPQERTVYDHKEGEEKRQLVFTAYYQGRYRVYRMEKPEDREEFYDVARDNYANVKEYKMDSGIKLDPDRLSEYSLRGNFSVSNANVTAGATDDGRFISSSAVTFTDTLGNHELFINTYTVSSFENYFVNYLNRTRRLQWGGTAAYVSQFFVDRFTLQRVERNYKYADVSAFARYPLSTWNRIEGSVGMTDRDTYVYRLEPFIFDPDILIPQVVPADYTEPYVNLGFSRDTIRYRQWGPQHGMSLDVRATHIFNASTSYSMDFRAYREVTARSNLAFRVLGNYSDGDFPDFWTLGGNNNLRGDFEYRSLIGSRRFMTQFEYRFPLIDALAFPGGFGFRNIRAAFFIDAGGTWFDDDTFNFEFQGDDEGFDPEIYDPDYLIGATGFNMSLNFQGLDFNWTWSRRTNFETLPSSYRMDFWIGRNF